MTQPDTITKAALAASVATTKTLQLTPGHVTTDQLDAIRRALKIAHALSLKIEATD